MRLRRRLELIAGRVNLDGSIASGSGFSVQKTGTGTYTLRFAGGFRAQSVQANIGTGSGYLTTAVQTDGSATVAVFNGANTAQDVAFSFTAAGA